MTHIFASMPGYNPQGLGWRAAYALDAGVHEVVKGFPKVTSVGVLGDQSHQQQKEYSAHNPLITAPDGLKIVTATDLVGPQADLDKIQAIIEARYNARDPRQYPVGFTQMNGYGTVWDDDPHTILHYTGADYGHLHWNINTVTFPIYDNYRPFMDDMSSWGIYVAPKPKPVVEGDEDDMQGYLHKQVETVNKKNVTVWYLVAMDLTSRVKVLDVNTLNGLVATKQYIGPTSAGFNHLTQAQVARIPVK